MPQLCILYVRRAFCTFATLPLSTYSSQIPIISMVLHLFALNNAISITERFHIGRTSHYHCRSLHHTFEFRMNGSYQVICHLSTLSAGFCSPNYNINIAAARNHARSWKRFPLAFCVWSAHNSSLSDYFYCSRTPPSLIHLRMIRSVLVLIWKYTKQRFHRCIRALKQPVNMINNTIYIEWTKMVN